MTKKKSFTYGLVTFIVMLLITTALAAFYIRTTSNSRKEKASFIADSIADKIEAEMVKRASITKVLEIATNGNNGEWDDLEFVGVAEALFDDFIDVVDISIAPDGIVSNAFPQGTGLEKDMNFFSEELGGVYADYSKMSQMPVIIAPTTLIDGTSGIIIRRPVYTESGEFWGFTSCSIDLAAFLDNMKVAKLADQGYEYKLISKNDITGENKVILEYSDKALVSPASSMISTVGGGYWSLGIAPHNGWFQIYEVLIVMLIAFIISVLSALFAYAYISMRAYAKELEVLSYRDALTNLENPRSYQEHMEELTEKKLPYGLVFMDLNDFKKVNDTYGHEVGDALLNITAKRLQNSIREKDKAFRIGGDEFVVVLHGSHDKKFYEGVIARMRQNVAREVVVGNITLNVSISAGYARCPEDGTKLEDVVKKADDAMYYNKRLMKARKGQTTER